MEPGPLEIGFDSFFGVPFSHNSPPTSEVFVRDRSIVGMKDGESIMDMAVFNRCHLKLPDTAIKLSAEAVRFIENNKDKPFFLYYPTTNVHLPIAVGANGNIEFELFIFLQLDIRINKRLVFVHTIEYGLKLHPESFLADCFLTKTIYHPDCESGCTYKMLIPQYLLSVPLIFLTFVLQYLTSVGGGV
jgi:hypothetical protein